MATDLGSAKQSTLWSTTDPPSDHVLYLAQCSPFYRISLNQYLSKHATDRWRHGPRDLAWPSTARCQVTESIKRGQITYTFPVLNPLSQSLQLDALTTRPHRGLSSRPHMGHGMACKVIWCNNQLFALSFFLRPEWVMMFYSHPR